MSTTNPILDALTREGVLIDVSVRYWRAAKKLRPEDLGLDPDHVTERLISLGHKRLLPRDALQAFDLIESRAHALVEASTFPFLGGIGHFLPNAKRPEVTTRLEDLEREFQQARQDFLGRYATLRTEATREWWDAARKLHADPDELVAGIDINFSVPWPSLSLSLGRPLAGDIESARHRLVTRLGRLRDEARELAGQDAREIVERFGRMGSRRFTLAA